MLGVVGDAVVYRWYYNITLVLHSKHYHTTSQASQVIIWDQKFYLKRLRTPAQAWERKQQSLVIFCTFTKWHSSKFACNTENRADTHTLTHTHTHKHKHARTHLRTHTQAHRANPHRPNNTNKHTQTHKQIHRESHKRPFMLGLRVCMLPRITCLMPKFCLVAFYSSMSMTQRKTSGNYSKDED